MHRLAHRVIATEGEGDVAKSPAGLRSGKSRLDLTHGLDEVDGVVVVLLDAGGDGEDIGIKDDVLGVEADLIHQQSVGTGADADLVLLGGGLTLFVKGHDDDGRTVTLGESGALEEGLLSILEADRVEDTLALETLHSLLKDRPLGAVDHDRHAADLWIRGKKVQEGLHHRFTVEHSLVDVHIEDICTALDLLSCYRECGFVVARDDELGESGRARDVGPLAHHHEGASFLNGQRLKSAQAGGGWGCGRFAGGM